MAVTSKLYMQYLLRAVNGTAPITTNNAKLKIALLKNTYTPNTGAHGTYSDVSSHEATGTGYVAGGKTLTGVTVGLDLPVNGVKIDAADAVWTTSTITARYAVIYISDTALGNPLVGYIDFGQDVSSYLGDYAIVFNAQGIATVSAT